MQYDRHSGGWRGIFLFSIQKASMSGGPWPNRPAQETCPSPARSSRHILKLLERRESYLAIRYEDVVQAPRESLERICQFVGIALLPELFVPTRASRQWQGNSSFHETFSSISAQSVDHWKSQLTEDEIWWIEMHCRQGMQLAGYSLQTDGRFSLTRWLKRLPDESWGGYLRARRASLCQLAGLLEHCRYNLAPAGAPSRLSQKLV